MVLAVSVKPYLSVAVMTIDAAIAALGVADASPTQIPLPESVKATVTGAGFCRLFGAVYVIFAETDDNELSSVIAD